MCKVLHLCAPEILSHITFALGHVAESLSDIALDERFADDHLGGEVLDNASKIDAVPEYAARWV